MARIVLTTTRLGAGTRLHREWYEDENFKNADRSDSCGDGLGSTGRFHWRIDPILGLSYNGPGLDPVRVLR